MGGLAGCGGNHALARLESAALQAPDAAPGQPSRPQGSQQLECVGLCSFSRPKVCGGHGAFEGSVRVEGWQDPQSLPGRSPCKSLVSGPRCKGTKAGRSLLNYPKP